MSDILVTGANGGLGKAIWHWLAHTHTVWPYDIEQGRDVRKPIMLHKDMKRLDVLINCAGVNDIDWLENFEEERWDHVMDVNAKGIYMMCRRCLPLLKESKGTIVNITSNAAWTPMTCSLAYNASKAAAHIMTRQLARELTKAHGITVFGIAPNKLRGTGMSLKIEAHVQKTRGWSAEVARQYQADALLTGEETPPEAIAEFLAFLLECKERHRHLSGCIIPYGA